MIFREAILDDIIPMHEVRMSVKENALSNPDRVKENDYIEFIREKGKGWVCENSGIILGFSIIDASEHSVWALFVKPGFEKMGIGRRLHELMLNWYFQNHSEKLWLGTAPGTRAESFYIKAGWEKAGISSTGESRFEITREMWASIK
jgi:GNAT superfamily N-acetyltransferase